MIVSRKTFVESSSIMIAVLLEALQDVLAVKTELAMAAVVVKVSIRITAQKPSESTRQLTRQEQLQE